MPISPIVAAALIGGGASVAGGVLANRGSQSQSTTPTLDPAFSPLRAMVLKQIQDRLTVDPNLTGYQAQGIADINKTYGATKQTSDNLLTARGLATSPVAANVDATREASRTSDVAGFKNSIPLIARQLRSGDLSQASSILGLGRGTDSTSTVSQGGGAAGAFTSLASYIGYLQGRGIFGAGQNSLYPVGGNGSYYAPSPQYGEGY